MLGPCLYSSTKDRRQDMEREREGKPSEHEYKHERRTGKATTISLRHTVRNLSSGLCITEYSALGTRTCLNALTLSYPTLP